jgi:acetyl-CoA carboxylase carboxyltransferase component
MGTTDRIKEMNERKETIKQMGGPQRIQKQHELGKLTARERLDLLFDKGTFRELGMFVSHHCTNFDMPQTYIASDGVVTGQGMVNGRLVFAFAQDFTSMGGTVGEMHAKKICKVIDLATRCGMPLVCLDDSGGARIQEGIDALSGYAAIMYRHSIASGVIPQISAVMGPTAGGAVYSPAMTDWVIMVEKTSHMFVTGPDVVKEVTGESVSFEELGGAQVHSTKSGVAHFVCKNDAHAIETIKELLSYLPSSNREEPPIVDLGDDLERIEPSLDAIIPDNPRQVYDVKDVIRAIVDKGQFLEPFEHYAPNIVICFARLDGITVGIIANQPKHLAGCLDANASVKASRFIRFCDAFDIPLLTIADVPGYLPGKEQEWNGIIRHGAKLLWSYAEATVPKLTLVTHKNYGGSYMALSGLELGVDYVGAWPTAEIAVMGAGGATAIIHRREIEKSPDPEAKRQEKIEQYQKFFANPYIAASRGLVDGIIQPQYTRPRIIAALKGLREKREQRPPRKHGNIPL